MNPFEAIAVSAGPTLTGIAALIVALRTGRKVEAVHKEVKPNNGLSNGESVDAILTKIIQKEPLADRSVKDSAHMDAMSAKDPAIAEQEETQT